MPRHIKVSFIGGFRSGKTSTAKLVGEHYTSLGFEHCHLSFAAPLREEIADALATPNLPRSLILHEMTDENLKARWRHIMQFWGTEVRRQMFSNDYWVDKLMVAMDGFLEDHANSDIIFTTDDCRFSNERAMLVDRGFKFIRFSRHGDLDRATRHDVHASEQEWRHWKPDITVPWHEDQNDRALQVTEWLDSKFPNEEADAQEPDTPEPSSTTANPDQ